MVFADFCDANAFSMVNVKLPVIYLTNNGLQELIGELLPASQNQFYKHHLSFQSFPLSKLIRCLISNTLSWNCLSLGKAL